MDEDKDYGRGDERAPGRDEAGTGEAEGQAALSHRTQDWGRQSIGAVIGAFIALILAGIATQLGWISGNLMIYALWGGVIGGLVGGVEALEDAGARLTGRDEAWINILVALLGMVLVFGFLFLVVQGASRLVQRFRGG